MNATYNITNNRLFFWPEKDNRLPKEQYEQAKSAGFVWWPRGCFTAIWSPLAEDFITKTMGVEVEDDDTPDDVEARVNRFAKYAQNDEREAASAQERAASANTARRLRMAQGTAERKAEEAAYWQGRIAGAIAHAERKDNPETIKNRIKGIETDKRRQEKYIKEDTLTLQYWTTGELTQERAEKIINARSSGTYRLSETEFPLVHYRGDQSLWSPLREHEITPQQAQALEVARLNRRIAYAQRWLDHYARRLEYETAYLCAVGGAKLLEPKPRYKRPTPEDGLKKGMLVTVPWRARDYITGKILSMGPASVRVEVPAEKDPHGYYKKGYQIARRYAKVAEKEQATP